MHIEAGNHLAFGYMEFPPLVGFLSLIQNLLGSNSVFVHHIFSHIASLLIFIFSALTVKELGGKSKAVFLILLCLLCSVAFTRTQQLFQPVVFGQLFWVLSFYQLARWAIRSQKKYLLYLFISLALGWMAKYDIAFLILGIGGLFFFEDFRKTIFQKSTLPYLFVPLVIILPNLIWQYQHDFPVVDHMKELKASQLSHMSYSEIVSNIIIHLNPISILLWLPGILFVFKKQHPINTVGIPILISISLLLAFKGKAYYFFPAFIGLMILGAVYVEKAIDARRNWLIYPITALFLVSGVLMLPYGMPILNKETYISYTATQKQNGFWPIAAQEFYSQELWPKTMKSLQEVFHKLPPIEKKNCIIWAKHYKQAGAVNLLRKEYQLPKAISYHGSFYQWAPAKGSLPNTMIALGTESSNIEFFLTYFNSVKEVKSILNIHADEEEDRYQYIYLCKNPKVNFENLKILFSNRIFE